MAVELSTLTVSSAALALVLLADGCAASADPAAQPAVHVVTTETMTYTPNKLVIHVGVHVVWRYQDLLAHTVTAEAKAFESGSIAQDGEWSYVAATRGDYPYGCRFHPTMKADLRVE